MPEIIPFLSLEYQHKTIETELEQAVQRVLKSNWFILGRELEIFEQAYATYCDTKFSAGVANGLDAITLSLRALNVGEGDEVIVPSHTYIATWLAVSAVKATIIPVEVNQHTFNIDVSKIESAISQKTKAIIPVHLYGQACDMNNVMALANRHNLFVIEDNAQAHGAMFNEKMTGSFGHCNATSFYPGKNLGALGDAGAITTDHESYYQNVMMLRNYGSAKKYYNEIPGVNSRLDEIQAAVLTEKLKFLQQWTTQRQKLAQLYYDKLNGVGDLQLPAVEDGSSHVYHLFVIRTSHRDSLQEYLKTRKVQTMVHYPVPPHLQSAYRSLGFAKGDFPIAEMISDTCLSLPLWPGMTEEIICHVTDTIKRFYE